MSPDRSKAAHPSEVETHLALDRSAVSAILSNGFSDTLEQIPSARDRKVDGQIKNKKVKNKIIDGERSEKRISGK